MTESNLEISNSLLEVGVDYVTVTSTEPELDKLLGPLANRIIKKEWLEGNERRTYRAQGYKGLQAGSVAFGRRNDGMLVRISGASAHDYFADLVAVGAKATRLDLQVTVRPGCGVVQQLRNNFKSFQKWNKQRRKATRCHFHVSELGPTSLDLGSRQSEKYGRIYDKFAESGLEHYRGALRYEVELKGSWANSMALRLANSKRMLPEIASFNSQFFSARGVGSLMPWNDCDKFVSPPSTLNQPLCFQWLAKSVGPSVRRQVALGRMDELLRAWSISVDAEGNWAIVG